MDLNTIGCLHCKDRHRYFLDKEKSQHLRQCPGCNKWFIIDKKSTESEGDYELSLLGNPKMCPVAGCNKRLQDGDLPSHLITCHDGSLDELEVS
jgi:hypothetical protein